MKNLVIALLQIIVINLFAFYPAYSEENPFDFLNDNRSVRAMGVGDAFASVADDGSAVHINSAGIAQVDKRHFLIGTGLKRGGLLGYIQPLQAGSSIGGSIALNQPNDDSRNWVFTGAYARAIEDADGNDFSFGLSAKVFSADASGGFCFDLGFLNKPAWAPLALGASVQNIGPRVQFEDRNVELPHNIRVGAAYFPRLGNQAFLFSTELSRAREGKLQVALGTETPVNHLTIRAGYKLEVGGRKRILSFGAGIHQKGATLNYALTRDLETGEFKHQIGLSAYLENRSTRHIENGQEADKTVGAGDTGLQPLNAPNKSSETNLVKIFVNPNTISPNNDGLYDEAVISIQKKDDAREIVVAAWKLGIYETTNRTKSVFIKSFSGTGDVPRKLYWNGQDASGQRVKDGPYYVQLFLVTRREHSEAADEAVAYLSSNRETITVDTKAPKSDVQANPPVFYISASKPGKTTFTARLLDSDTVPDWVLSIYDEDGRVVQRFKSSGSARWKRWDWDGVGDNGNHLSEGRYIYVLTLTDSVANSASTPPRVVEIKKRSFIAHTTNNSQTHREAVGEDDLPPAQSILSAEEKPPEFQVSCFPSTFIPWSITSITPEDDDAVDSYTTFTVKSPKVANPPNWRSQLVIYNRSGKIVMAFPLNQLPAKIKWDGRDQDGSLLPLGNYTFLVESIGKEGQKIPTPPLIVSIRERENIIDKIVISSDVMFDFASAQIKPTAYDALKSAATAIRAHPNAEVSIEGHTCDIGGDAYNIKLSTERATSVYKYLIEKERIAKDRLSVMGYGESRPIMQNDSEENRAQNRRVEIIITTNE